MFDIFANFINDMIKNSGLQVNSLKTLADNVFYIDKWIGDTSSLNFFTGMTSIVYDLAIWLLVLKFLRNGFETYITLTGGDLDNDPMNMVSRYIKAMILAISFPVLYEFFARICTTFLGFLLEAGRMDLVNNTSWLDQVATISTSPIANFVFWLGFIILYFQLLKRGVELLVLRLCFPIACVGLLEGDNGAYAPFVMMIFKTGMTTLMQLTLLQLAYNLVYSLDVVIGLAVLATAIGAPKLMQQFMVPSGGGGMTNKVLTAARISEVAIRAVK